jgi:hypothetical protein
VEAVDLRDLVTFARDLNMDGLRALLTIGEFAEKIMTNVGATDLVRCVGAIIRGTEGRGPSAVELSAIAFQNDRCHRNVIALLVEMNKEPGVRVFTRALAAELGKDGVRVNAVGLGLIERPLNAQARANDPDIARLSVERTPLGRTGQPEDVVGPAIFLASDLAVLCHRHLIMCARTAMATGSAGAAAAAPQGPSLLRAHAIEGLERRP